MADFGWAFLSGAVSGKGDSSSVQYLQSTNGPLTGSDKFTWNNATDTLIVTGSVYVSGSLYTRRFSTIHEDVIVSSISVTGSTSFGDSTDDTHAITGSLIMSGALVKRYNKVVSTPYTVGAYDSIIGISSSTSVTINLPAANSCHSGRILIIKDEFNITRVDPSNVIIIDANGSDRIDDEATYRIAGDKVALSIYTDGISNWFIY